MLFGLIIRSNFTANASVIVMITFSEIINVMAILFFCYIENISDTIYIKPFTKMCSLDLYSAICKLSRLQLFFWLFIILNQIVLLVKVVASHFEDIFLGLACFLMPGYPCPISSFALC